MVHGRTSRPTNRGYYTKYSRDPNTRGVLIKEGRSKFKKLINGGSEEMGGGKF